MADTIGTWSSESSTTSAKFDNFNVWHPAYAYDENGNLISDGEKCYEYNEANQLKKVKECGNSQTIAEYVYDYTGLRTVKKNYTTGTLANTVVSWSDSYESKTPVGGSAQNTAYYWVNGELLAKKDNSSNRFYYQNDHLGSTGLLTNSGGAVVETTKYDPWGKVNTGGTMSKFQYTGQEKDSETGLNYYNARYYSSDMRHFTQPDDIMQNAYDPQMLNKYAYVKNNPERYTDPSGHFVAALLRTVTLALTMQRVYITAQPAIQKMINSPTTNKMIQTTSNLQSKTSVNNATNVTSKVANSSATKAVSKQDISAQAKNMTGNTNSTSVRIDSKYVRPNGATTKEMREAVNIPGTKCHECGKVGEKMVPDHVPSLVEEYYQTGTINIDKMKSLDSIMPQCITCSRVQGGQLSNYSKQKAIELDL